MARAGLNQAQLAAKVDVSQAGVSKWLNGTVPKGDQLLAISQALGVSMEQLLTGTTQSQSQSSGDSGWKERAVSAEQKLAAVKSAMESALKKI